MNKRHEAVLCQFRLPAIADRNFGRAFEVDATVITGKVCAGRSVTMPPDSTPRIEVHHPYSLKERLMLAAIAKAGI